MKCCAWEWVRTSVPISAMRGLRDVDAGEAWEGRVDAIPDAIAAALPARKVLRFMLMLMGTRGR